MSDMMVAVLNHAPRDYRFEKIEKPKAGPGEVIIKIDAAGICGSDGKCFIGAPSLWDNWVKAPVVPGHEFFGTVVELGPGAAEKFGLKAGDKTIAEQIYPCERCRYCRSGKYWMCEIHDMYGFQKQCNGGWAEYMRLGPNSRVHKMPNDIRREDGVLVEPLSCAIHAVERGDIQLGDTVVLAGAGPLGLLMLQIIKLKNPGQIIVTDAKPDRLEFVRREFERDARQLSCEEFRARLEPAPCRTVPGRKCRIPTCFRGPGALSFRKLRARVESSDTIDNCLTFALLWLAHARRSSADGAITGLRLVVPKDTSRTVAHRVGALDSHLAVELYEHNSLLDILEKIDPRRAGNVDTWLVPARESEALLQRAKPALESIVAARGHAAIARCAAHSTRDILRDWSIFRDAITQR